MKWIKILMPYFFYQTMAIIFGFLIGWHWGWVVFPTIALAASVVIALIIMLWITLRKRILKK